MSAWIGLVCIDLFAGVVLIEHLIEVMSVVLARRARGYAPDEAVFVIDVHTELEAKVALAVPKPRSIPKQPRHPAQMVPHRPKQPLNLGRPSEVMPHCQFFRHAHATM